MACFQLGPEKPRPFAVLTEGHSKHINLPPEEQQERYSFGASYENELCSYIGQYLELGTADRLCYVGPSRGSLMQSIMEYFCLTEPVTEVEPGHIVCQESAHRKRGIAIRVPNVGAEEFFRREADKCRAGAVPLFDKVLLRDAVPYLQSVTETFSNILATLMPGGRLLIIHRAAPANTLPLFNEACHRMEQLDRSYAQLVADLEACQFQGQVPGKSGEVQVQWQIQSLPVIMAKDRWLSMVRDRFPPQLEVFSDCDVRAGVREMVEGTFKYQGQVIEFNDRLLFASATQAGRDDYPSIQRFGASGFNPFPGMNELRYNMELTTDLKKKLGIR